MNSNENYYGQNNMYLSLVILEAYWERLTVTYLARTGLADFLIFMDLWKILDGE